MSTMSVRQATSINGYSLLLRLLFCYLSLEFHILQPQLSHLLRCLPRRALLGTITALRSNELRIFQCLSGNAAKCFRESASVGILALVESKGLLVAIPEQMKRLDINIGSMQSAFEKRPEVFQSISVNLAACVAFQMVNDLAVIILFQIVVRHKCVCANCGTYFDMFPHISAKLWSACCLDDLQNHAREFITLPALKNALHWSLGDTSVSYARSTILVHVASLSADVGFVCFNVARELANDSFLHRKTDALQHEPRRLLSNTQTTVKLIRANSILAVSGQPHCRKPFVETDRRIFKDRSDLHRKLLFRMRVLALPQFRVFKKRHFLGATMRTLHATRPAQSDKKLQTHIGVREISDSFKKRFRCFHNCLQLSTDNRSVKYIITVVSPAQYEKLKATRQQAIQEAIQKRRGR